MGAAKVILFVSGAQFAMLSAPCHAQLAGAGRSEATQADTAAPAPDDRLDDIIVTATRRPERLQDVPVAVTALTSEVLERENVREVEDLTKLVPGLTIDFGSQPGNFSINMRGVGTFSNGIAVESDVAVVIDDVPVSFQAAAFKDLIDIDRVEALRGPQSTLFGKSAVAGVLNITTQAPTDRLTARFTGLVTDDREWRVGGTVAGPIGGKLGFRVTASKTDFDGIVRNLTTGGRLNGTGGETVTAKLQWEPSEDTQLVLQPRYNHNKSTCCVSPLTSLTPGLFYQGIPQLPEAIVLAGIPIGPANRYVRSDVRAGGDSTVYGATLRMTHVLEGGATIASITSFDRYKLRDFQDTDGTDSHFLLFYPRPPAKPSLIDSGSSINGFFHSNSITQELRVTSAGDQRLQYVFGLWYARNELDRFLDRGPVFQAARYFAQHSNTNYAVYGQATFSIDPSTRLIGGIRANRQDIDFSLVQQLLLPHARFARADSDSAVTGRIGVQHNWTPDVMGYATYSTGYKGQAYDLVSTFDATQFARMPVPPETAKNYEVGLKTSLFGRRVFFNTAAFWTDFKGFQTSATSALPDGTFLTFLQSIGALRTAGVEFDLSARPVRSLRLNGAASYTEAEYRDFENGPCFSGQTALQGCIVRPGTMRAFQNLRGKGLKNSPRFKFNVGGQYDLPSFSFADLFVGANYRWQSEVNFALNRDPRQVQSAYGVMDLRLGASTNKGSYRVTLFSNNVFDRHYARGVNYSGSNPFSFNAPGVVASGTSWSPARDALPLQRHQTGHAVLRPTGSR